MRSVGLIGVVAVVACSAPREPQSASGLGVETPTPRVTEAPGARDAAAPDALVVTEKPPDVLTAPAEKDRLARLQARIEARRNQECPFVDADTEGRVVAIQAAADGCVEAVAREKVPMVRAPLDEVVKAIGEADANLGADALSWREPALVVVRTACRELVRAIEAEPLTVDGCLQAPLSPLQPEPDKASAFHLIKGLRAVMAEAWARVRERRADDGAILLAHGLRAAVMASRRHRGGGLLAASVVSGLRLLARWRDRVSDRALAAVRADLKAAASHLPTAWSRIADELLDMARAAQAEPTPLNLIAWEAIMSNLEILDGGETVEGLTARFAAEKIPSAELMALDRLGPDALPKLAPSQRALLVKHTQRTFLGGLSGLEKATDGAEKALHDALSDW